MPKDYRKSSIYDDRRISAQRGLAADETAYDSQLPPQNFHRQLEQALDILFRRKWVILLIFGVVMVIAGAYAYTRQPHYKATSYIIVDLATSPSRSGNDRTTMEDGNLFASSNRSISEELLLLQVSSPIPRRVAWRLQEMADTSRSKPFIPLVASSSGNPPPVENIAARVNARVDLAPAGGKVVQVTARSPVPKEAAMLANLYAEEYEKLTQEASRAQSSSAWKYLQMQEQKWSSELREVERKIQSYLGEKGTANLSQEGSYLVTRLANLEAQRDEARIQLQMHEQSVQSLNKKLQEITPQLATRIANDVDQQIQNTKAEISELEASKEEIERRYPPEQRGEAVENRLHEIDRQIAQLQGKLEQLSRQYVEEGASFGTGGDGLTYVTSLRQQAAEEQSQIDELQTRMDMLNERIEEARGQLQNIPSQSMQMAQLERSRLHAERMYQTIMERMLEARLQGGGEQPSGYVRTLRKAGVPGVPVQQNIPRIIMLGLFFGALLGLGVAVVLEKLDNRIYKPDQLNEMGKRVMGVVPNIDNQVQRKADSGKNGEGREQLAPSLVTLFDPLSAGAESYRHLRTSIQFSLPVPIQTLLVTSPNKGEGKSVTAANLAIALAQAGRRTLLIDADLRRPRLSSMLNLSSEPSLLHFLTRAGEEQEEILRTQVDNLWAIPAGGPTKNSAEVLSSVRMENMLHRLRQQFDVIIFDTPPMMATNDAAQLASKCDATLLVTRSGRTREKEFEDSVQRLSEVGADHVGVLLNGFDLSKAYGYTYRYSSYYGFGDGEDYGDGYYEATNEMVRKITT